MDSRSEPVNEIESSSSAKEFDYDEQKIKYFNSNFTDASGSSCQAVLDTPPSSKSAKARESQAKPQPKFNQKTYSEKPKHAQNLTTLTEGIVSGLNFSPILRAINPERDVGISKEMSLAEIGFDSTQVDDWDKIIQPRKESLISLLKDMIQNYIKTDVIIRIGDKSFNCHMMVLQCYSGFFLNIDNKEIICLPQNKVSQEAFVMIYDWILSPEPKVQREGILQLFIAAQFLKIDALVDQCWVCLDDDERFCEDAAFLLYIEARSFKLDLIMDLMLTRICKFFIILVASKEFLELDYKEVCTLLNSNSIGVNSESEVLMVAVRWLNFDWQNRQNLLLEIIKCVRFGLMPPWLLVDLKRNQHCNELQRILNNKDVVKMIDDGLSYVLTKGYYSNTPESYFDGLERFNLVEPQQRQWICDEMCSYHHKNECPNSTYVTYETFLRYLTMVRGLGRNHWKKLQTRPNDKPYRCKEGGDGVDEALQQMVLNGIH
ncbi:hypothetical protein ACFFRR_008500 [Megaselia abdita]